MATSVRTFVDALLNGDRFDVLAGEVLSFLPASNDVGAIAFGNATLGWDFTVFLGADGSKVTFDSGSKTLILNGVAISSNAAIGTTGGQSITGNLAVTGNVTVTESLTVEGANTVLNTDLTVTGNSTLTGVVGITGNATVTGNAIVTESLTVEGTATVLNTTLGVTGNTSLANVAVTGPVAFSGSGGPRYKVTNLTGDATLNGTQLNGMITNRGALGAVVVTLSNAAANTLTGDWFEYWGVADQTITFASSTADTLLAGVNDAAADSLAFSTAGEKIGARATAFFDGTQWHIHAVQGTATIVTA